MKHITCLSAVAAMASACTPAELAGIAPPSAGLTPASSADITAAHAPWTPEDDTGHIDAGEGEGGPTPAGSAGLTGVMLECDPLPGRVDACAGELSVSMETYPYEHYALDPSDYPSCQQLEADPKHGAPALLAAAALTNKLYDNEKTAVDYNGDGYSDPDFFDDICADYLDLKEVTPEEAKASIAGFPTGHIVCEEVFDAATPPGGHTSSVFTISNPLNSTNHRINRVQSLAASTYPGQPMRGCWLLVEMNTQGGASPDPNLMWAAVIYGMVNYETPAALLFSNGSGQELELVVYRLRYSIVAETAGDLAQFRSFIRDPQNVGDPGNIEVHISGMDYSLGGGAYSYPLQSHAPLVNRYTWEMSSSPPPLGIIDPATPEEIESLYAFTAWAKSNLDLQFD